MDWSPLLLASLLFWTTWLLVTFALKIKVKTKTNTITRMKTNIKQKLTFKLKRATMDWSPILLAILLFWTTWLLETLL